MTTTVTYVARAVNALPTSSRVGPGAAERRRARRLWRGSGGDGYRPGKAAAPSLSYKLSFIFIHPASPTGATKQVQLTVIQH